MLSTLAAIRPKKRLFLGFLLITEFLIALALYGIWKISYLGLENISEYLPAIVGAFLIFMKSRIKVPANKLLVLVPHCLQLATCPHKITRDPNNCKRCGGCNIGDLMKLSEELGFVFFVATGGTLARQVVIKNRPQAVLAIACERDLMSGIQDVYPLPAVGVLNIRPNGPCYNTRVDMEEVKKTLSQIIEN